jgi:hypothetical protein
MGRDYHYLVLSNEEYHLYTSSEQKQEHEEYVKKSKEYHYYYCDHEEPKYIESKDQYYGFNIRDYHDANFFVSHRTENMYDGVYSYNEIKELVSDLMCNDKFNDITFLCIVLGEMQTDSYAILHIS